MFKSKKSNPAVEVLDTVLDTLLPKKKASHRKRNGLIVVGVGAASALAAAALNKKSGDA